MPLTLDLTDQFIRDYGQLLDELERARSRPAAAPQADPGLTAARDRALADLHQAQLQLAQLRDANEALRQELGSRPSGPCPECADARRQLAAAQGETQAERSKRQDLELRLKQTKSGSQEWEESLGNLQAELDEKEAEIVRLGEKVIELERDLYKLRQKK